MGSAVETLIDKVRAIGALHCTNQMYCWPGFDPTAHDPAEFFGDLDIEFDGELFIRYRVEQTFSPVAAKRLATEERKLGANLPDDYKSLLLAIGEFHLPGNAKIQLESPATAIRSTRSQWCFDDGELPALAISQYHETSDGDGIGFIRQGKVFLPALFEFQHDLRHEGDDPRLWSKQRAASVTEFLLSYLENEPSDEQFDD